MNSASTFYLRLFGSPSLEHGDGAKVTGRPAHRHRLALLALLSVSPSHRLSREKLVAYLWPEAEPERGRNLLNVATYVLRATLGENALISEGEDLRLNTDVILTDVAEFNAAVEQGDHARVVSLYPGPLLDGFFLSEAPEFEHWVTREREILASAHGKSLEALAEAAEAAADFAQAAEWWKARVAQDQYDSRVALRLMLALDASGNRAGALQHATAHGRLLQQEFGVGVSSEIRELANRLRIEPALDATPNRFGGNIVAVGERPSASGSETGRRERIGPNAASPPSSEFALPGRARGAVRRNLFAAAALLAVIALSAAAWYIGPRGGAVDRSIVVLPFVNVGPESDSSYFSDGVTEEIISSLSSVPALKVISRTSAMHYRQSEKTLRQIAHELNVANVLRGSVRRDGELMLVSAQLVRAGTNEQVWAKNYEHRVGDTIGAQEQIVRDVARALDTELGQVVQARLARRETRDPEALELYLRGRFHWGTQTKEGHEKAISYFFQAIARDSGFAAAYAGLADAYMTGFQLGLSDVTEKEAYARLKWAAERVIALDENSADARTSLAIVRWCEKDWPAAERELRKALVLNPAHSTARSFHAQLLSGLGRNDEALLESRRAYELDRFALMISSTYAWRCYLSGDYDCAIEQFKRTLEINPSWAPTYRGLGRAYAQKGMRDEALQALKKATELAPESRGARADLAYAHAKFGETRRAREILSELKGTPGFAMARAYAMLGEKDSAFALLGTVYWKWPYGAVLSDPGLNSLRSDPRFAELSTRIDREMGLR